MTAEHATARIRRQGGTPVLKQAESHAMMRAEQQISHCRNGERKEHSMAVKTETSQGVWEQTLAVVLRHADSMCRANEPDDLMDRVHDLAGRSGISAAMDSLSEAVMQGMHADDAEDVGKAYCMLAVAPLTAEKEHLIMEGMPDRRCRTLVFLRGAGLYDDTFSRLFDTDVIVGRGVEPGGEILYDGPDVSPDFIRGFLAMSRDDGFGRLADSGCNPVAYAVDLLAFMAEGGGLDEDLMDRAARLMRGSMFGNGIKWAPLSMDEETLRESAKPLPGAGKGSPAWRMLMDLTDNAPDPGPTADDMRFLIRHADFTIPDGETTEGMKDKAISLAERFLSSMEDAGERGAWPCHLYPQSLIVWALSAHDADLLKAAPEAWRMLTRLENLYTDAEKTARRRVEDAGMEDTVGIYTGSVKSLLPDLADRDGHVPDSVIRGKLSDMIQGGYVDADTGPGLLVDVL